MNIAQLADIVSDSPDYRVLRRLAPTVTEGLPVATDTLKQGLYLDCETTGLDTRTAVIIELALVPFMYSSDGVIHIVEKGFSWFNDPGFPIPAAITALTGITDADVAGKSIEWTCVSDLLEDAAIVIAHHADYDRKIVERSLVEQRISGFEAFERKAWGCSMQDVPWAEHGFGCRKLGCLLANACRSFHDGHRALDDVHAGVHLLAAAKLGERNAMSYLLEAARQSTIRIRAERAPFHAKDLLKARGYHWNADRRVWFIDVRDGGVEAELAWLAQYAECQIPTMTRFTALDRYSIRAS